MLILIIFNPRKKTKKKRFEVTDRNACAFRHYLTTSVMELIL